MPAQSPLSAKPLVVCKVGGQVGDHVGDGILDVLLALRQAGADLVLVHGGGAQISSWLERLNIPVRFDQGRRVTDDQAIDVVEMVLSAQMNKAWVSALQQRGVRAAGISGRDGNLLLAQPRQEPGRDWGRVGQIERVDTALLDALLAAGHVPVISPVANDAGGRSLNINADEAAAAIAKACRAHTFLLFSDVAGVLADPSDPQSLIERLDPPAIERLRAQGVIAGGMLPKLDAALEALAAGVRRIYFVNGTDPETVRACAGALRRDGLNATFPGTCIQLDASDAAATAGQQGEGAAPGDEAWIRRGEAVIVNSYRRLPIALTDGWGSRVRSAGGRVYLDFIGGLAVNALGHGRQKLADALQRQARAMIHCTNLYWIPQQIMLAEKLCELSGMERWFFANSGAEANEAAIKCARKYGTTVKGPDAYQIIVAERSFHGRTMGALSATAQAHHQRGFGPLVPGFVSVPYNDIAAVEQAITPQTCAIMVEPIQGEGGVHVPEPGYLKALRELCDRHQLLLILDEIQTGIGRTGRWFACQHEPVRPDIMTVAKALANGVPIGAMGVAGPARDVFGPGDHASTFGGNPLATAAALTCLSILDEEQLVPRAGTLGQTIRDRIAAERPGLPAIVDVRGRGLLIGIEVAGGAPAIQAACRERGLLVNAIGDTVIRMLPSLDVPEADVDEALAILFDAIRAQG